MILVLGSGFGLYGHVAALAAAGEPVSTLARYRRKALERPELAGLVDRIEWVADDAIADAQVTTLACRPAENLAWAEHLIADKVGGTLVLEKPIAPNWRAAQTLEQAMLAAGRAWRTPYLFLHCDWFPVLAQDGQITVRWRHRQPAGLNGWKAAEDEGGGAINFYFIHWLAVLEALLPGVAARYTREPVGFSAGPLEVVFELGEDLGFEILIDGRPVHQALTPFGAVPERGLPDPRIPMLQRFYQATLSGDGRYDNDFQMAVTRRWREMCDA